MRNAINRRTFVMGTAALTALGMTRGASGSRGPNDMIRIGVIGVRSRGAELAREFAKLPHARVVALCDVDASELAAPSKAVEEISGQAPRTEADFRKLLDDKSIDAVAIATPDHWHALLAVMACQAGKDVYTEKPASHNVVEGRRMIEAARKYDRVVQLGTQRRSMTHVKEAIGVVQSGEIGKVGMAKAWIHQQRKPIGKGTVGAVPNGVDWNLWQGPAPDRPFMANRFHYNWHWFWNWGTGEIGNNGIHGLDVARWGLGVDAPLTISSSGGKYLFDDDQEVPDTQVVSFEFPNAMLVWEHRMWSKHPEEGNTFGIAFYGDQATLIVDEKGWLTTDPSGNPPAQTRTGKASDGLTAHLNNFLDCVQSRNKPNADIEIGHLSTRLCHFGNIAHRVGQKLRFDAQREAFTDQPEADSLLSRDYSSRFAMPKIV